MLNNINLNKKVIITIASALGELNSEVMYVGGAVVSLYINDPSAEDVRPTKDLDISMEIASAGELEKIRKSLLSKGFRQSTDDNVICRFRYEDIKVDVMGTKAIGWAPANPWFAPGFTKKETVLIEDHRIQILPLPYFLASKFEAFNNRGARDPRTSHDFEDIVYVFDNCIDIVERLLDAEEDVKPFLKEQFYDILNNRIKQEAIYGNLSYETRDERYKKIMNCINKLHQNY